MHRILADDGSLYLHCDHTASAWIRALLDAVFGRDSLRNEIVWNYRRWPVQMRDFQRMHDTIFRYAKGADWTWNQLYEPRAESTKKRFGNKKIVSQPGADGKRAPSATTTDENTEALMRSVWDIKIIAPVSHERIGWPTQKPIALYERIIWASSNVGDVVFDPFAGCSTTLVAAEKHGRRWLGCDIDPQARKVVFDRLMDSRQLANPVDVRLLDKPPVRTDDEPDAAPDLVLRLVKPHDRSLPRPELLERLVLRDGLLCQGCGLRPVDGVLPPVKFTRLMEIDHNQPRSAGGSNHVDNRVLLCGDCNRTKSDTMTLKGLRRYKKRERLMVNEKGMV